MAAVDRDVYATTDGARYATAIYAVLDTAAPALTIVNAGHPALLVLEPGAERPLRVEASGPALGLITAGMFESRALPLGPGAIVVAVTDGVSEAQNAAGDEFGDDRLAALVSESRRQPARQLCERILEAVRRHRGLRQDQDDVTVMVMKHQGS